MPTTAARTLQVPLADLLALPWTDLHGLPHARTKVLWSSGQSLAGVLRLEPGASLGDHVHEHGEHHAYVLEGACRIDDRVLTAGSYAHVPAGVRHEVSGEQPDGCQVFYLFVDRTG